MSQYRVDTDNGSYMVETEDKNNPDSPPYDPQGFDKDITSGGLKDATVSDGMMLQGLAGLGKAAAAPLIEDTIVPTLERTAADNALRSTGASVGQVRQMGVDAARQAGKYAIDNGLSDVFSTEVGRMAKLKNMIADTGENIGNLREAAGDAPKGLAEKIGAELAPKYANGVYSGEQGSLAKALEDVKNAGPTHADLSETATKLNDYAKGARQISQPDTAVTDVANALSRENNSGIVQSLGSDEGKEYVHSLDEMSKQKPLEQFMERGEAREAAGRGSNTLFGSVSGTVKDFAGHRLMAKGADAAAEGLEGANMALDDLTPGLSQSAAQTIGGVTSHLMDRIQNSPQSLGQFAKPLMNAAQTGGSQGLAAMHYVLASQYPEYNSEVMGHSAGKPVQENDGASQ